jgi:hypothetical protein
MKIKTTAQQTNPEYPLQSNAIETYQVAEPDSFSLSRQHRDELEQRLLAHAKNPSQGIPWRKAFAELETIL